jgi:hypothetical protein
VNKNNRAGSDCHNNADKNGYEAADNNNRAGSDCQNNANNKVSNKVSATNANNHNGQEATTAITTQTKTVTRPRTMMIQ